MFKADILHFLRTTQAKQWDTLAAIHGDDVENRLIQRLYKEMDLRGRWMLFVTVLWIMVCVLEWHFLSRNQA